MNRMNTNIRIDTVNMLMQGKIETREIVKILAKKYNTTKQRICGNLSYLKRCGAIHVFSDRPHSVAYL
ncbi:hypothetical protein [Pygmaiobacter massiliensis]|uniref:hypothetical protein n=1 Tax=Pygmaiobacter massiliensis TaxID=1917873 RepID=UPI002A827B82|nr:hypothetical protein [Pygmaiobacter massiliensis]MDY4784318.1 hypothetical protein [Pygmaiobacter massiliensis]